ncbi:hypothetical protein [Globicatella sanguinis]|uniref:hypothetical protein n=1 Tax=Globicatella sanguinis TaxID=13076 RepID=UPI002542790B|nr:hypothetical protein [Globicatella sanguinis]WIK66542.1 hypothetical protein CYJ72_000050 [Globicatella sanguinis]WKT55947.1 hypothetical protein Q3C38_00050 [Globicatella sanguinis]
MAFNTTVALYLMGESGKLNDSTENLSEVQKGRGVTPHPIRRFSQVLRYRKSIEKNISKRYYCSDKTRIKDVLRCIIIIIHFQQKARPEINI